MRPEGGTAVLAFGDIGEPGAEESGAEPFDRELFGTVAELFVMAAGGLGAVEIFSGLETPEAVTFSSLPLGRLADDNFEIVSSAAGEVCVGTISGEVTAEGLAARA